VIDTTYGEVRGAYIALTALSREGLQIPLAAALKWKRILGVLRPLVQQSDEQQNELVDKFAKKDDTGKAVEGDHPGTVQLKDTEGFKAAIEEMLAAAVQVGCDRVQAADFGPGDGLVSSRVVELLGGLGPFFEEAGNA
jgi:hypothetical protein